MYLLFLGGEPGLVHAGQARSQPPDFSQGDMCIGTLLNYGRITIQKAVIGSSFPAQINCDQLQPPTHIGNSFCIQFRQGTRV